MTRKITVVPYNPKWPETFALEAQNIKTALGTNCVAVHHIGSTAVPGLAAKPVIDIIPEVKDIMAVDQCNQAMQALGYQARGEYGIFFRRYFQKGDDERLANIHVFETGNSEIERYVTFRDWLRIHDDDRDRYAAVKKSLAEKYPNDIEAYTFGKEEFVVSIDGKTGWHGSRVVAALTPKEWQAYHRIFDEQLFAPKGKKYDSEALPRTASDFHFVFLNGHDVVTVAHVEWLADEAAVIREIVTDEPFKGRGFASAMMVQLAKWLQQQGKKVVKVQTNAKEEEFYRKQGYTSMSFDGSPAAEGVIELGKVL